MPTSECATASLSLYQCQTKMHTSTYMPEKQLFHFAILHLHVETAAYGLEGQFTGS